MSYDSYGRPVRAVSPYGATTTYTYSTPGVTPVTQTKIGPNGVTTTTLDGLGRPVRIARGDTNGVRSYTDTLYAPCACSPLGKVQKVSQPYAPNATTVRWTAYSYDGLGRQLSVTQPDGVSSTTYAYSGNQITITDPRGKWKQFTNDIQNNLVAVVEPDPDPANQPGGTLSTSYGYDWMNHLTDVMMTRGSVTQKRTFAYDDSGRLTSATNPENGTVAYFYNNDNTLQYKHDAKGQDTVYTYDSKKRVTMVQRYANGRNNAEDTCQRVTYTYDANLPNSTFSENSIGRLTAVQYGSPTGMYGYPTQICVSGAPSTQYAELYSYHPAGAITAKRLQVTRSTTDPYSGYFVTGSGSVDVEYTYDQAGRPASLTYPFYVMGLDPSQTTSPSLTFSYSRDSSGRPTSMSDNFGQFSSRGNITWAQSAQFDEADRATSMQYFLQFKPYLAPGGIYTTETRSYNTNGELASISWNGTSQYGTFGANGALQYAYYPEQDNGQVARVTDTLSGETVSYEYDALKRLIQASSDTGNPATSWVQAYQYDGFGNLTQKALAVGGGSPTITSSPVNGFNQLANASYDLNGNMISGVGATFAYDVSNRLASSHPASGGYEYYGYAPDNKRIYKKLANGNEEFTLYGVYGERLGVFALQGPFTSDSITYGFRLQALRSNVWFGNKLIWDGNAPVFLDRVGTNRAGGARFYPYGEEITGTSNDRVKFGTYTRDGFTGLDYADQRYYASAYGRFGTPDPARNSSVSQVPSSWNRYAYTYSDPINRLDPSGLTNCDANGGNCYDSVSVSDDPREIGGSAGGGGVHYRPLLPAPDDPVGSSTQGAGSKQRTVHIANLTNSSAQAVGVQNSLRWIQSHIGSYGDCDGWLSGNNDVINTLLGQSNVQTDSVDVGRFSDPFVNAVYGTAGTDLPTDGTALLTVNLNGAYFNSSVSVGAGVSGIIGGSDRAKLFILLHELAHATEAAEFQSGDSTPDVQAQNNSLLLQKCGDFIKSVSN